MSEYRPPLEEIDFVLNHIVDIAPLAKLNGYQHADPDTIRDLLEEAGRFFSEVMAPLDRIGDEQGSQLQVDGTVKTPDGFRDAYIKYVEAGWGAVHLPQEWGGGGLPHTVAIVLQEMFKTANMGFALGPMLTQAGIEALISHGTHQQKSLFLNKLVPGKWTGTMCLTEPQAGSDIGALATRAERQTDGSYRLFGQKIFITWGDHDLTDNIVHLVLARVPGAPPGTKGISMFIVPKHLVNPDGSLGERNDVTTVSLEHKLGIHASPTCVISFGEAGSGATGYLIGEEQSGMLYMFTMMNTARIGVGVEGLAIGERAYQAATRFAGERRQGRSPGRPATETAMIIEHPDVRRMLMTIKAYNQAMRCLIYDNTKQVDLHRHAETTEERERAGERVALLTPITKAWCTDLGVEMASLGLQVHGGMGYIEETGAAQILRDSRIAPIYEGTNGIQAIDLVLRKLPLRNGAVVAELLAEIDQTVGELADYPDLGAVATNIASALQAVRTATATTLSRVSASPLDALASATPYLRMLGLLLGGWYLARSAMRANIMLDAGEGNSAFLSAKLATSRFYGEQLLPQAAGLLGAAIGEASALDLGSHQ